MSIDCWLRHIFFFYSSLVGFLGDQKRRDRLETRGLCCVLLPFFPRTSHCPSNETTKGTGTKNNARNLPKYALYTGCFISVANWSECTVAPIMDEYIKSNPVGYHDTIATLYMAKTIESAKSIIGFSLEFTVTVAASLAIRGEDSMI